MGHHFADGLVVCDHPGWRRVDTVANGLAVDFDLVAVLDALTHVGRLIIDRDPPLQNQLLHLKARPQTRLGQDLV